MWGCAAAGPAQPPPCGRPAPGSDEKAALHAPGAALWTAGVAAPALEHRKLGDALGAATLRPSRMWGTPSAVPWAGGGGSARRELGLCDRSASLATKQSANGGGRGGKQVQEGVREIWRRGPCSRAPPSVSEPPAQSGLLARAAANRALRPSHLPPASMPAGLQAGSCCRSHVHTDTVKHLHAELG